MNEVAAAYSPAASGWQAGPARIYDVLSEHLVAHAPCDLDGRRILDLGAGAGAASQALLRRNARPVGLDAAEGMLRVGADRRPPAIVGDVVSLPVRTNGVDGVVAAYSLNHVVDPATALREAARVTRRGGPVLASAYASDDGHAVKAAVDQAAAEAGHRASGWHTRVRSEAMPLLATVELAEAVLRCAGLRGYAVHDRIPFPDLAPLDLVAWRLGMPQFTPLAAALDTAGREHLVQRALDLLGDDPPMLERSVITIVAII